LHRGGAETRRKVAESHVIRVTVLIEEQHGQA
jgi:hypothetical protein